MRTTSIMTIASNGRRHHRSASIVQLLHQRDRNIDAGTAALRLRRQTTEPLMRRLRNEGDLTGHSGCVNALQWSSDGRLLASVSDDCHLMVWDAFRHRCVANVHTDHEGNVFAVKFMPHSGDRHVATGAADNRVMVHDVERSSRSSSDRSEHAPLVWQCRCHAQRVKSLAVAPDDPHALWTSSEDGQIIQFDLREKHRCCTNDPVSLINLCDHIGQPSAEARCIAINARRPHQLAVGANDPFARIFDLRNIKHHTPLVSAVPSSPSDGCVTYLSPGHFQRPVDKYEFMYKTVTSVAFSPDGNELLVNVGADQIYLYDLVHQRRPQFAVVPSPSASTVGDGPTLSKASQTVPTPASAERLKKLGNKHLADGRHYEAIAAYSRAICEAPHYAALYLNRAIVYARRDWCGDQYASLRDCQQALRLQPDYVKAHFRGVRSLMKLNRSEDASTSLEAFCMAYPAVRDDKPVQALSQDVHKALFEQIREGLFGSEPLQKPTDAESAMRKKAWDYEERFVGHCNTTTDIKQANFFGNDGNYIVAGSDDGNFFIWNRHESRMVQIYEADSTIVNCVQPHPFACMLATSGIDDAVRLWSPCDPRKDDTADEDADEYDETGEPRRAAEVANSNQQRMKADPFDAEIDQMLLFG